MRTTSARQGIPALAPSATYRHETELMDVGRERASEAVLDGARVAGWQVIRQLAYATADGERHFVQLRRKVALPRDPMRDDGTVGDWPAWLEHRRQRDQRGAVEG
jgi:hypothetical protein